MQGWDEMKCQNFIDLWFDIYPGVKAYMKEIQRHARQFGYVKDMFGRIRFCPAVRSSDDYAVEKALREAGNMPIQGGAQGVIKKAMGELVPVYKDFRSAGFTCNPLIQIHDDILFEIQDDILDGAVPVIQEVMENVVKLKIPIPVDPKVGKTWGNMWGWDAN